MFTDVPMFVVCTCALHHVAAQMAAIRRCAVWNTHHAALFSVDTNYVRAFAICSKDLIGVSIYVLWMWQLTHHNMIVDGQLNVFWYNILWLHCLGLPFLYHVAHYPLVLVMHHSCLSSLPSSFGHETCLLPWLAVLSKDHLYGDSPDGQGILGSSSVCCGNYSWVKQTHKYSGWMYRL